MTHDVMKDLLRRITDLERRANNVMRPGKVVDIDEKNWRVRIAYSATDSQGGGGSGGAQQPVISPWIPWSEQSAGNVRSWNPPTVGQQVNLFSPSGEIGQHSWMMPGGFTTEPGQQTQSKPFKPPHNKRDELRESIQVIEDKNHLQSSQPPAQDNGAGDKKFGISSWKTSKNEQRISVEFKDQQQSQGGQGGQGGGSQDQQYTHKQMWENAKKRVMTDTTSGARKTIVEDVDGKKRTVHEMTPGQDDMTTEEGGTVGQTGTGKKKTRRVTSPGEYRIITEDENGKSEITMKGGTVFMKTKNLTWDVSEKVEFTGQASHHINPSSLGAFPPGAGSSSSDPGTETSGGS